jgi:hypothetical protein
MLYVYFYALYLLIFMLYIYFYALYLLIFMLYIYFYALYLLIFMLYIYFYALYLLIFRLYIYFYALYLHIFMLFVNTAFFPSKFSKSLHTAIKCKAKIGPHILYILLLYPKKCYHKKHFLFFQAVLGIQYISKSYYGSMCLQPSHFVFPPCYYWRCPSSHS